MSVCVCVCVCGDSLSLLTQNGHNFKYSLPLVNLQAAEKVSLSFASFTVDMTFEDRYS